MYRYIKSRSKNFELKQIEKISQEQLALNFQNILREISELEMYDSKEAINAYCKLLQIRPALPGTAYAEILSRLAACYEKQGSTGEALFYLCCVPDYLDAGMQKKEQAAYNTRILACLERAYAAFKKNQGKLNIVITGTDVYELNCIADAIKTVCLQTVFTINGTDKFSAYCRDNFLKEYDILFLAGDLFRNRDDFINEYYTIKQTFTGIDFYPLVSEKSIREFQLKNKDIRFYMLKGNIKMLYAMVLITLLKAGTWAGNGGKPNPTGFERTK